MQFIEPIIQFLKKHYEKIILCVVLLGLAAAVISMSAAITRVQDEVNQPIPEPPSKSRPLVPLNLTTDLQSLAQVTNPPPVVLSGDHNLFNPVTWKKKANGEWLKILKTGPDALSIVSITPLYTVIAYNHPSPNGAIYIMNIQVHSARRATEYAKQDEKTKLGLYIIRGIKGAPEDPTELQLEIPETGEMVWISKDNPYKRVDGYIVDMNYAPESLSLPKERVNDTITLDNEQYKIVEITNDAVRVQAINNTKITTINWNGNP
jgi:hypothetical protein